MCTQAAAGFYLNTDVSGYYTGEVKQCGSTCETCSKANSCDTCGANYTRFGCVCIYALNIQGSLTLAPGPNSSWFSSNNSDNINLAYALLHCNEIALAIALAAGYSDVNNTLLTGMKSGSIVTYFTLGVDPNQNPSTFADNFQNKISSGVPGFTVVSLTTASNGFGAGSSSSSSSKDLGLILGLSIPLGLLCT